jgi:hypothetical protein
VDTVVTCFLSWHAWITTSPECWPQCSPFFNFLSFTIGGTLFLLTCKVPTLFLCVDFMNQANSGEQQKINIAEASLTESIHFNAEFGSLEGYVLSQRQMASHRVKDLSIAMIWFRTYRFRNLLFRYWMIGYILQSSGGPWKSFCCYQKNAYILLLPLVFP